MSNDGPRQGRFFSVTLFSRYCLHFKRSWFLDTLTIFRWVVIRTRWPETFSRLSMLVSEWGLALTLTRLLRTRIYYHQGPISFERIATQDASLLVAPLFRSNAWAERCVDLSRAVNGLCLISSQDTLCLLRASFGAPRVQHLLRCC